MNIMYFLRRYFYISFLLCLNYISFISGFDRPYIKWILPYIFYFIMYIFYGFRALFVVV